MFYAPILSDDGRLTADRDPESNSIRIKDVVGGKELAAFQTARLCAVRTFSPDGKVLAVHQGQALVLYSAATGEELRRLGENQPYLAALRFSPDGRTVVAADSRYRLWDAASGQLVREFPAGGNPRTVALSPDGRLLASCEWPNAGTMIRLREVLTGKEVRSWTAGGQFVQALAFSPDGRALASSEDCAGPRVSSAIHLWDVDSGKELLCYRTGRRGAEECLAFSPDGRRLAAGAIQAGNDVRVWDVSAAKPRQRPIVRLEDKELERLWSLLAGSDASRANEAVQLLARAEGAAAFLRSRVPHPLPRVKAIDPKRFERLIEQLDDDNFRTREKAMAELRQYGGAAVAPLRQRLDKGGLSVEAARRVRQVVESLGEAGDLPLGLLQWLRAIEVLERIGTAQARQVLATLAEAGPDAPLTREAKAARKRLAK